MGGVIRHIGKRAVRRDSYTPRTSSHHDGGGNGVGDRVDYRDAVGVIICHIGKGSVWRDGNSGGVLPHWDRGDHTIGGSVDDRNGVRLNSTTEIAYRSRIGYIGELPVRRDSYPKGRKLHRNHSDRRVSHSVNHPNRI